MPRLEALALGLATCAMAADFSYAQKQPSGAKEQAARLASEAEQLGKKQQFADALNKYKEAAKLDPATAAYQCNVGMAYYALGDEARSHLYLSRCQRANHGWPTGVQEVFEYELGVLAKEDYTPLKITGSPPDAQVVIALYADEGPLDAPLTIYVPFARYEVTVRASGYEPKTIPVEANNRAEKQVVFELEPAAESAASDGSAPVDRSGAGNLVGSSADVSGTAPDDHRGAPWGKIAIGAGVGLALLGGGGYALAFSHQNKAEGLGGSEHADEVADMRKWNRIGAGLLIAGGVTAALGVVLLVRGSGDERSNTRIAVSAAPSSDGGVVVFSWTR